MIFSCLFEKIVKESNSKQNIHELLAQLKNENSDLKDKNDSLQILLKDMQEECDGVKNDHETTKKQLNNLENSSTQVFHFLSFLLINQLDGSHFLSIPKKKGNGINNPRT